MIIVDGCGGINSSISFNHFIESETPMACEKQNNIYIIEVSDTECGLTIDKNMLCLWVWINWKTYKKVTSIKKN